MTSEIRRRREADGPEPWTSTAIVERIHVDYYGARRRSISSRRSRCRAHQIVIQPWDHDLLGAIEKAILESDVGLTPNVDGTVVRLNIPPSPRRVRKDIVKSVHKRIEEARVAIRNLRRDATDHLKREDDGTLGADRRQLEQLQKITDHAIADVDRLGGVKEQEVLEVCGRGAARGRTTDRRPAAPTTGGRHRDA